MKQRPSPWRWAVTVLLAVTQPATVLPSAALAQGARAAAAAPTIQRGQDYYEQARFDEAITLLRSLVDGGKLAGDDLQKARELLARSYVKKGYATQGREMFKALLAANPAWRPDPIRVPPDESAVFDQALKEFQSESAAAQAQPSAPAPAASTPAPPAAQPAKPDRTPTPAASLTEGSGKKSHKTLWYVLGGAAVVGIAVAAGGGGGGGGGSKAAGPSPLGGFPGTP